jgi:serine/threonine protein kinase
MSSFGGMRRLSLPISITGTEAIITTYGERDSLKQINQYLLLGAIGEGSFSRVFIARHCDTGQTYAVKRIYLKKLSKSSIGVSGIRREITLMSRVSHPNIVTLHEAIYVKESQAVYLVLDYAACGNLASIIKTGYIFSEKALQCIFRQVADGVSYLHQHGIVHQDLKPQNVLLTAGGVALISDFGTGHSFQSYARGFGTPAYQAPELINSTARDDSLHPGKEDIWSLGITLHSLVFGKFPFVGGDVFEVAKAALSTPLEQPEGADDELWDLILGMLNPDPAARLDIAQVLAHPWLTNAPEYLDAEIPVRPIPCIDEALPIHAMRGEVLDSEAKFDLPDLQPRPRLSHFDAPFPIDQKLTFLKS